MDSRRSAASRRAGDGRNHQAEIIASKKSPNKIRLTEAQQKCLVHAIDNRMPWETLVEWWTAKGWPGRGNTLRNCYSEITGRTEIPARRKKVS